MTDLNSKFFETSALLGCCLLIQFFVFDKACFCQNNSEPLGDKTVLRIEHEAHIAFKQDWDPLEGVTPPWSLKCDLGTLPAGKKVGIILKVTAERPIHFDQWRVGCMCYDVKVSRNTFDADPNEVVFEFTTEAGTRDGRSVQLIGFSKNGIEFGEIQLVYALEGSLYIGEHAAFEMGDGVSKFQIPIFFTKPIGPNDLNINWEGPEDVELFTKLVEKQNCYFVELMVHDKFSRPYFSGTITLNEAIGQRNRKSWVTISKYEQLTVSPGEIVFKPIESANGDSLTASILIKLRISAPPTEELAKLSEAKSNSDIDSVHILLLGKSLLLEKKQLASGICRLNVTVPVELLEEAIKSNAEVEIVVHSGVHSFSKSLSFFMGD